MSTTGERPTRAGRVAARVRDAYSARMERFGPEGGDAVLYGISALFALGTGLLTGLAGYRVWAWFALGPYAAAALVSAFLASRRARLSASALGPARSPAPTAVASPARQGGVSRRGARRARAWILVFLLLGATLAPLALEVALRNDGSPSAHVQPEVVVIARAGTRLSKGKDPYYAIVRHDGRVESAVPGQPVYESFFPYLPLMAIFGLPKIGRGPVRVTDTRVLFSVVTLLVVGAALLLLRAPGDKKMRTLQFLTVLPSAALPLATGGDDLPIVAFLLLAMVLAQRRRPGWSGIVLGIVSAMKFTAWPLAFLALFAARDRKGRRAPVPMALGVLCVAGPVIVPFALSNLRAFFDNVVLFPLGASGVTSPAASNLPGHLLVINMPFLHAVLPAVVALVGGVVVARRLLRRPPQTAGEVLTLTAWMMLVAIAFAPATRVGYLLYPTDFFVWAWMFDAADRNESAAVSPPFVAVA